MSNLRIFGDSNTIPLPQNVPSSFNPISIRHYVYEIDAVGSGPANLTFNVKEVATEGVSPSAIYQYVERIREGMPAQTPSKIGEFPFGFRVDDDCWVVLQLGQSVVNWRFAEGNACVKTNEASSKLFGLTHHVVGTGVDIKRIVAPSDCKVLFFGVSGFVSGVKEYINIYTNFMQLTNGFKFHSLPVIFDPDVKNSGDP